MQYTKDSFLLLLRDRLAAFNPERTVIVDGQARPAVLAAENETATAAPPLPCAFYLRWGACAAAPGASPLQRLECEVSYRTGAGDSHARGRVLAELDDELARICDPPRVQKRDWTQSPAADLGSVIFWTPPQFAVPEDLGSELRRGARLVVFFSPEESQ